MAKFVFVDGINVGECGTGIDFNNCARIVKWFGGYMGITKILGTPITKVLSSRNAVKSELTSNGYWLYENLNKVGHCTIVEMAK